MEFNKKIDLIRKITKISYYLVPCIIGISLGMASLAFAGLVLISSFSIKGVMASAYIFFAPTIVLLSFFYLLKSISDVLNSTKLMEYLLYKLLGQAEDYKSYIKFKLPILSPPRRLIDFVGSIGKWAIRVISIIFGVNFCYSFCIANSMASANFFVPSVIGHNLLLVGSTIPLVMTIIVVEGAIMAVAGISSRLKKQR